METCSYQIYDIMQLVSSITDKVQSNVDLCKQNPQLHTDIVRHLCNAFNNLSAAADELSEVGL